MPEKYKDLIPANANIEIEYGKKDAVKFSYPIAWTYRKAVAERAFPTIITFFILAFVHFLTCVLWVLIFPAFCILLAVKYIDIELYDDVMYTASLHAYDCVNIALTVSVIYLCISLIIPFVLALNKNLLSCLMPKFGYYSIVLLGKTKEKVFITVDVENNKCIIPNFSNVFLNYKATGDFSKYLKKVKILAYDFRYHTRQRIAVFITHKKQKNDFVYYAIFEFTKTPVDGYLDCEYY